MHVVSWQGEGKLYWCQNWRAWTEVAQKPKFMAHPSEVLMIFLIELCQPPPHNLNISRFGKSWTNSLASPGHLPTPRQVSDVNTFILRDLGAFYARTMSLHSAGINTLTGFRVCCFRDLVQWFRSSQVWSIYNRNFIFNAMFCILCNLDRINTKVDRYI